MRIITENMTSIDISTFTIIEADANVQVSIIENELLVVAQIKVMR
tara:strand:+ start:122 stop:256 length:135 start_codon:yes stop_codon:yes gene_type:complete